MATSQNGYPVLFTNRTTGDLPRLRKWIVPGTGRHFYLRDGSAGFLLIHAVLYWHDAIENIDGGIWDEWGWAVRPVRGQATGYSNHASGTAVDVNATKHPLSVPILRTFTPLGIKLLRARIKFYRNTIRWGGEWSRPDGMHMEIADSLSQCEKRAAALLNTPRGKAILAANPGAREVILKDNPWAPKPTPEPPKPEPTPEPPKPEPSSKVVRVGTRNVKTGGGKMRNGQRFAPEADRMTWAIREANENDVTVLALQEFSTVQAARIDSDAHPRWDVHSATPNVRRNGKGVGNGVAYRRDVWDLIDSGELVVHVGKVISQFQIPEDLHLPWVVLRHKVTSARLRFLGVHYPAGQTDSVLKARRVVTSAVKQWANGDTFTATVVAGDTNGKQLQALGSYVEVSVDRIVSPNRKVTGRIVTDGWMDGDTLRKVSDHHGLSGQVEL